MPTPRAGESKDDFIERCIPVVLEDGTADDSDQAVAVCNSMWEQADKQGNFRRITYNGVTVQATGRRSSDRAGKKYARTVRRGDSEREVHYGDPNLPMRRTNPDARRNFMARHNCSEKKDPFAPGFWACYDWANTDEKERGMTDSTTSTVDAEVVVEEEAQAEKGLIAGPGIPDGTGPMCSDYIPIDVTTFAGLDEYMQGQVLAAEIKTRQAQFSELAQNVFANPEIDDKASALRALADEFAGRLGDVGKEADRDKAAMKTVGGKRYPAGDFLVVEDSEKPTTWHLQVKRNGTPDRGLASAAWAALFSPGGHRGNSYQGPDKEAARRKLKALYRSQEWDMPNTSKAQPGLFQQVVDALKSVIPQDEPDPPANGLMLWKEEDGTYTWLARYSNNFRDDDNPPEIITAKSHQRFVDLVDSGEAEPPELWLWHRPEWKWGHATWVAYDDTGFALAGGKVDKGKEPLADAIMAIDPGQVRVSHGMPIGSVKRDADDPSLIVEHLTRELSPLPAWAAANQLTGFIIQSKEADSMAIPQEKRKTLQEEWNLSDQLLGLVEAANASDKESAEEAGIEHKEKDATETTQDAQPEGEGEAEVSQPLTRDELGQVVSAIGQHLTTVNQQLEALAGQVKELTDQRAAADAETLTDLFERAIGHEKARVDRRTKEAKAGPRETQPDEAEQVIATGNPLVDNMVSALVTGAAWDGFKPQGEV